MTKCLNPIKWLTSGQTSWIRFDLTNPKNPIPPTPLFSTQCRNMCKSPVTKAWTGMDRDSRPGLSSLWPGQCHADAAKGLQCSECLGLEVHGVRIMGGSLVVSSVYLADGLEHVFVCPYIGNNHPNWLIFFRGVETTNQLLSCSIPKTDVMTMRIRIRIRMRMMTIRKYGVLLTSKRHVEFMFWRYGLLNPCPEAITDWSLEEKNNNYPVVI